MQESWKIDGVMIGVMPTVVGKNGQQSMPPQVYAPHLSMASQGIWMTSPFMGVKSVWLMHRTLWDKPFSSELIPFSLGVALFAG